MVNWDLLKPRNVFIVAVFALLAYGIFNHFSGAPQKESA